MTSEPTDVDAEDLFKRIQMSMMLAEEEDGEQTKKTKTDNHTTIAEAQKSNQDETVSIPNSKPEI